MRHVWISPNGYLSITSTPRCRGYFERDPCRIDTTFYDSLIAPYLTDLVLFSERKIMVSDSSLRDKYDSDFISSRVEPCHFPLERRPRLLRDELQFVYGAPLRHRRHRVLLQRHSMADSSDCQSQAGIHRNPPVPSRHPLFYPRELLLHEQSPLVFLCFHVYRRGFDTLGHYANTHAITAIVNQFSEPRGFVFSHVELFVLTPTEFCLTPYTVFPGSFLRLPASFCSSRQFVADVSPFLLRLSIEFQLPLPHRHFPDYRGSVRIGSEFSVESFPRGKSCVWSRILPGCRDPFRFPSSFCRLFLPPL